ncbi:uncharacterized protein LOC130443780 [Diorhabda sublineata]|uniref:uncharacterized protein LOC130443780 n=1 Tax=Diorhabda sublineata TaxID=1163346 RepID=UPI0024E05CE9|nr:uncharacterized protein LOC130443780 [Diorhabda sublineata]
MMKELAFPETLVISELDGDSDMSETVPNPVGALVLNILVTDAVLPESIKKESIDEELEIEVMQALQKAKQVAGSMNINPDVERIEVDQIEEQLQKSLTDYDRLLNAEMMANTKKFIVHVSSQFNNGFNCGSRITAWVDRKFHTLEEKRTEYLEEDAFLNEKSLYIGLLSKKYYVRHTSSKEDVDRRKYYSLAKCQNLVCEGANFILMRYLAITRYKGEFELSTTYINGDLCRNIYECTGPFMGKVNNKDMEVCKIYRHIIEKCGIEHMCVTVLTVHGKIVTQEWDGCNYIININPLQFVSIGKPSPYDRKGLENTWYDDLQLFFKYLDYKVFFYFNHS